MNRQHTVYYIGGPRDAEKVARYGDHPQHDTEICLQRESVGYHVDAAGNSIVKAKEVEYRIMRSPVAGIYTAFLLEDLRK